MDDKRRQPAVVVAILALLGAASLPQAMKNQGASPSQPPQQGTASTPRSLPSTEAEAEEMDQDRRDLRPLLQYLSSEGKTTPADGKDLKAHLAGKFPALSPERREDPSVHCMIITLPDPVASVASARFDEHLDVVQRAVELQGYILDRSQLPWRPTATGAPDAHEKINRIRTAGIGLEFQVETVEASEPRHGRPGLIVFKQAFPAPGKAPIVLLVFVVPESPILGVDKGAFARSLGLIDRYFCGQLTWGRGEDAAGAGGGDGRPAERDRILHIVAPCFTSSQRSLEVSLGEWKGAEDRPYHFRVISNNAGQIDRKRIEEACRDHPRHRVSFRSMVHQTSTVAEEMLGYINTELGYDPYHVALLIESNSGMVQALAEHVWKKELADEFIFPIQVSEVRKAYEKHGLLDPDKVDGAGAPDRLAIPPDESGEPTDVPRSYTPSSSAAFDEMALTQILTTIGHRRYHAVGIVASNPFDVVFLARRVRRFCPNVRLFAIQADLLFARTQNVADLRGMLVASTYSLYPSNQWVITPYGATPRVLFNDQGGQGLYNAIVAHLWEMDLVRESDRAAPAAAAHSPDGPPLLDFGMPYRERGRRDRPPIWIGSVGERGIFPVASVEAGKDRDYLYDPGDAPDEPRSERRAPPAGQAEVQRVRAMRPNAHLLYWFLCLLLFFGCFLVAGLTWAYVRWSADPAKKALQATVAGIGFKQVLLSLNCEVAPRGYDEATYDPQDRLGAGDARAGRYAPPLGAGVHLALINLVVLGLSAYVFSYLLVAMRPHVGHMSSWIYVSYSISMASVALVSASTVLAMVEVVAAGRLGAWRRHALFWTVVVASVAGWWWFLRAADVPSWRLRFERISNLPNGVSPLFPLLFLAGAAVAWIHSQLSRRRLYRLSYLPAAAPEDVRQELDSQPEKRLREMRTVRAVVDRLIARPSHALRHIHPLLPWVLMLLFLLLFIRTGTRGIPRSFEGWAFDRVFWSLCLLLIVLTVVQALQLLALWGKIRKMLQLAVTLPMAHAFDRIPQRIRSWFFGTEDFSLREELVLQQSTALKKRTTEELAAVYRKLFPGEEGERDWSSLVETVRKALDNAEGTLDSTRSIYPLLDPIWDALPVEGSGPRRAEPQKEGAGEEWKASWPLMPADRARLDPVEHQVLRDWTRMAEDLVALQIVRWFAPAASQLLPIIRFLVVGPLLLLLAITSYPFDHAGWLMSVMVTLILFVATAVGIVLIGTNRDELISRVSDTTPGSMSLDSGFVASILTTIGPLLGALLAISFDLSDLLHTWFGPMFQLF